MKREMKPGSVEPFSLFDSTVKVWTASLQDFSLDSVPNEPCDFNQFLSLSISFLIIILEVGGLMIEMKYT